MEKKVAHYQLADVKRLVAAGRVYATASAFRGARDLGIDNLEGICAVVVSLTTACFYKSMTTHADHKIWQDVYHGLTVHGDLVYLKLTLIEDVLVVSFKELDL